MADSVPSSSFSASHNGALITELNPNDVILGRGRGPIEFAGNKQFRSLVDEHKEEYASIIAHKDERKSRIAREIFDRIHALGGRFVKQVEKSKRPIEEVVSEAVWCEVDDEVALEKCRRILRQRQKNPSDETDLECNEGKGGEEDAHEEPLPIPPANVTSVLPSFLVGSGGSGAGVVPSAFHHQAVVRIGTNATNPPIPADFSLSLPSQSDASVTPENWSYYALRMWHGGFTREPARPNENASDAQGTVAEHQSTVSDCDLPTAYHPVSKEDATAPVSEEFSEFLLSFLEDPDRPRFTERQRQIEQSMQTDEERAEALSDLFGKQCEVSIHQRKRPRRDLDSQAVQFLVNQMRLQLSRIPNDRKRALVEAQTKCHEDEFSDTRLERFLRCEGMNAKLGAQRFVNYWECRRQLFGPDKFVLRMTLSDALCDDLAAVRACLWRPLPHLDTSGRQLLLWDAGRQSREGYTWESMLRAAWYVTEVTAQSNTDVRSGIVRVCWLKDSTIWDFNYRFHERFDYFDANCWPVRILAHHVCCASWLHVKVIKPIVESLREKHIRSRTRIHDCPKNQLLNVLSEYGILNDMLPTVMGGTVRLDQAEWIANRRAAELNEI